LTSKCDKPPQGNDRTREKTKLCRSSHGPKENGGVRVPNGVYLLTTEADEMIDSVRLEYAAFRKGTGNQFDIRPRCSKCG